MFFILNRLWTSLKKFVPQKKKKVVFTLSALIVYRCNVLFDILVRNIFYTCHEPYFTPSLCHLIQISFHPSQTFHQRFRHFRHFQTLHYFVAPSLVTCCFVTRHPSPVTSSHRHSIVVILHYQFPSLPSFVISDLFRPY